MIPQTKKCTKCGWEYPITHPERSCRFCGTAFEKGICSSCGEYKKLTYGRYCTQCNSIKKMAKRKPEDNRRLANECISRKREFDNDSYNAWLYDIMDAPLVTLTEKQWLEACAHFKGCAYCDSSNIDSRSMFIPFKDGGRYTAWNIIPACEKCETKFHTVNTFVKHKDSIDKIVGYLQPILERMKNEPKT